MRLDLMRLREKYSNRICLPRSRSKLKMGESGGCGRREGPTDRGA